MKQHMITLLHIIIILLHNHLPVCIAAEHSLLPNSWIQTVRIGLANCSLQPVAVLTPLSPATLVGLYERGEI